MYVLGIDPGLTKANPTGWCVIDIRNTFDIAFFTANHLVIPKTLEKTLWHHRVAWCSYMIGLLCSKYQPGIIGYELPPYMQSNPQTMLKLSALGGSLFGIVYGQSNQMFDKDIVYPVTVSEAKEALGGKGNVNKEAMIAAAQRLVGQTSLQSPHVADSVGVAIAAYAACRHMSIADVRAALQDRLKFTDR